MIVYLAQGLILGATAGASIGPFQIFLLSHAVSNGWKRTLPAATAPLATDIIIVPVVLLVLTRLPGMVLNIVQIVGALFVLYLAWGAYQAFRAAREIDARAASSSGVSRRVFLKAMAMNFVSPGPYIFWGTILGPIVLRAWGESPPWAMVFVAAFYTVLIGLTMLMIVVFGIAGQIGAGMNRALQGFAALALLLFGIYQLGTGIARLVQTV